MLHRMTWIILCLLLYILFLLFFFFPSYFIQHLNPITFSILFNYATQIKKMARHKLAFVYHTLGESKYLCDKGSYNL